MDMHPCDLGLDLIDGGAAPENVGDQLEIRDIGLMICFGILLVLSVVREIEEAGGEAFLIHALHHQLVLDHRDAHVAIYIGETSASPASGDEGFPTVAARYDNPTAVIVGGGPLDRARHYGASVLGFEGDACAGIAVLE